MAWFTQDEVLKPIKNIQTDTALTFFIQPMILKAIRPLTFNSSTSFQSKVWKNACSLTSFALERKQESRYLSGVPVN